MLNTKIQVTQLVEKITSLDFAKQRKLIAVAGPPAAGKSTLSAKVAQKVNQQLGYSVAIVVPMDGFHLDDRVLKERNLLASKGAPQTFDIAGLHHLLKRLKVEEEVIFSHFDRQLEISRAGAGVIEEHHKIIICEGNYLLLNQGQWIPLHQFWDLSVMVTASVEHIEKRLIERWINLDYSFTEASKKAHSNDIPNAHTVLNNSNQSNYIIQTT